MLSVKPHTKIRLTDFIMSDYVLNDTSLESLFHVLFVSVKIVVIKNTFCCEIG